MGRRLSFAADLTHLLLTVALSAAAVALGVFIRSQPVPEEPGRPALPDRFCTLLLETPPAAPAPRLPHSTSVHVDPGVGARAKGEEGASGRSEATLRRARGTKVAMSPSSVDKQIAENAGLLAELSSMEGTGGLATGGAHVGGVIGTRYGSPNGSGGLGSRGSGLGGGGTGDGLASLGTRGRGRRLDGTAAAPAEHELSRRLTMDPSALYQQAASIPLRAAETDDNVDFDEYLAFLEARRTHHRIRGHWDPLDVADRRSIGVVDGNGDPIPAAVVRIRDAHDGRLIWTGTTYGDGRIPYYPDVAHDSGIAPPRWGEYQIDVESHGLLATTPWDGREHSVQVAVEALEVTVGTVPLDVLFVLDTTGSMNDEIDRIKDTLLRVTDRLGALEQEFDLRYGAVLYRDRGDSYVTRQVPLMDDLAAFDRELQAIRAGGGGDTPEALNEALHVAVTDQDWRPAAAKVAFLIADAPPHMYPDDTSYAVTAVDAVERGIRVHAVAASGLDEFGTVVFRQVAQVTRGKFIFIEYGSVQASAAHHGVAGEVSSNNLDEILYRQIADELEGWGRPAGDARSSLVADASLAPQATPQIDVPAATPPVLAASIAAPAATAAPLRWTAPPAWMWLFAVGLGLMLSRLIRFREP